MTNQAKETSNDPYNFKDVPARVDKIRVKGLGRTKDDIVVCSLKNLFKINTFEQMIEGIVESKSNLERLYCFKSIGITIDTSSGSGSTPDYGYDVIFNVTEMSKITGRMTTTIENNQGTLGLEFMTPNLAGRGETIQIDGKYGYKEMRAFNLSFLKPLIYSNGLFGVSGFKRNFENIAAGYKHTEYGLSADLSFAYRHNIKHYLTWEGIIRNINVLSKHVPFCIREQCGYSLKSSFKNVLCIDNRDSKVLPSRGSLLQLQTELAGLGGDIGFVKNEITSQFNLPISNLITFQSSFAAGIMNTLNNDKRIAIVDNFFIGGPLTLRGFQLNGAGPMIDDYSLGGSLYFLNSFHIYTPLPHKPKKGSFGDAFRIHLFCNTGNVTDVSGDFNECMERLSRNFRLSYGIGLVYRFRQLARFELNYCMPVLHYGDKIVKGIQFGFGVQFA